MEKRPAPKRLEGMVYKNIPVTHRPGWVHRNFLGFESDAELKAGLHNKTVLDLGAGRSGFVGDLLSDKVTDKAYAVDFIYNVKEEAGGLDTYDESNIPSGHRVAAHLEALPFKDESVECIVAYASLPLHAEEPKDIEAFFAEVARVLAVGGEAYIGPTKNFIDWMSEEKKSRLAAIIGDRRKPVAFEETAAEEMQKLGMTSIGEYQNFLKKKYQDAEAATASVIERMRADPSFEISDLTRTEKRYAFSEGTPIEDSIRIKKLKSLDREQ